MGLIKNEEPVLFPRLRKRLKQRRQKARASKEEDNSSLQTQQKNPESGRTFAGQSDVAYCLECVEGHTMGGLTEMRHAVDRYRTAGKMTTGVTEKVRVAIGELLGINEDVRNTKDASPEVKKGLEEILNEVRWIRKEYGMSGKGLTRGYGNLEDLEELRNRIFILQNKAYSLVEKCPTCKPHIQETIGKAIEKRIRHE